MTTKQYIAEAILDEAVIEYADYNLSNAEVVQAYAEGAGRFISTEEAEKVLKACRTWLCAEDQSADVYYYTIIKPLGED